MNWNNIYLGCCCSRWQWKKKIQLSYQEPNEIIGNKDEDDEKKEEEAVDEIFQKKKRKRSKKIFFDFYTDEDIDKMIEKNWRKNIRKCLMKESNMDWKE